VKLKKEKRISSAMKGGIRDLRSPKPAHQRKKRKRRENIYKCPGGGSARENCREKVKVKNQGEVA